MPTDIRTAVIAEPGDRGARLRQVWDATRIERIRFLLGWQHPACNAEARRLARELIDETTRTEWMEATDAHD